MAKNWTREEESIMERMIIGGEEISSIARYLRKSENAVYLKAYRMKIPLKALCPRPTIRLVMEKKFGDVSIIQVNRNFYEKTGISQKRWPKLLFGYIEPTQDEILAVAEYFKIENKLWAEFLTAVQLQFNFG